MLPGAALPAATAPTAAAAGRRAAAEPGGRDVLAHVGVGQGAGEKVHRVVHQGRLRLKRYILHIQLVQNLPLTSKKSSTLAWPALAWPGQSGTLVLKSTGGFAQAEWSPCMYYVSLPA